MAKGKEKMIMSITVNVVLSLILNINNNNNIIFIINEAQNFQHSKHGDTECKDIQQTF